MKLKLWQTFYSYGVIPLFWLLLHAAGLCKRKVRLGIEGRSGLIERLRSQTEQLGPGKRVWFHASSLGEFEQAKPIIAELKRRHPDIRVIASFFSPSGYDHSRNYPLADVITYLPFDSQRKARAFLDVVAPDVAVLVRYDVWPNHIWELHRRGIPVMIANATMRTASLRKLPLIRGLHHHVYDAIDMILTVSANDAQAFGAFRLTRPLVTAIGDTRYDQVTARSAEARKRHLIPRDVLEGRTVIVAGSTWPEDEEVLLPAFIALHSEMTNALLLLVPHEPTLEHIESVERALDGRVRAIRFSALNEFAGESVIIVDSIGILMTLYATAHVAYIGGSFKQGVHNVLEAAVYGIPVLFGPRHRNSQEPLRLVEHGGAFVVSATEELQRAWHNLLTDELARTTAGRRASNFVQSHVGATERFLEQLEPLLDS